MFSEVGGDLTVSDAILEHLLEIVIYDEATVVEPNPYGVLVMGALEPPSPIGTTTPRPLAVDTAGRLILTPGSVTSAVDATIVAPLDGFGVAVAIVSSEELTVNIDGATGSLPPFAATPTVNVGTMPAVVVTSITDPIVVTSITDAVAVTVASLPETEVYIDGTKGSLPAFAATPTVNLGQVVAAPAASAPSDVVVVGGIDTTAPTPLIRTLPVVGQAAVVPGYGVPVMGSNGTDASFIPLGNAGGYPAEGVMIAGVYDGSTAKLITVDDSGNQIVVGTTTNQATVSATRAGGTGIGSTNIGPAAGTLYVTSVALAWSFGTVTLSGAAELIITVEDSAGQVLARVLISTAQTGLGSIVVTFPDDGVPAAAQCVLNFGNATITTLTGAAVATIAYRQ